MLKKDNNPADGNPGAGGKVKEKLKPTAAFYGLICVIIGVIDLVNPEKMLNIIAYAIGISAIVCGIIFVIMYMVRDVRYNINNNDFLSGIVAAVIGVMILIKWQELMALVPMILGVFIIVSGCIKLQDCIDLRLPQAVQNHFQNALRELLLSILAQILHYKYQQYPLSLCSKTHCIKNIAMSNDASLPMSKK